jgi:hypothetical protein
VADADIPSSWSSAGRNALGNSLWILPLVTFERATEEHYYQAVALGVFWLVALVIAVKLHVIEELISSRERQQQLLTWALILSGTVLLAWGIFRLASSPATIIEVAGQSDVQARLDAMIIERDKAKQEAASVQSQFTSAIKERDDARLERDFLTPMVIGDETSSQEPLNERDEATKLSVWDSVTTSNVNTLTGAYNLIDNPLRQWLDMVKSVESKSLVYDLGTGKFAFMKAAIDLEKLREKYQNYQDVVGVLAPQPNRAAFAKAVNDFSDAVSSMQSDMMPPNYDAKLMPLAGALRRELNTTLGWLQTLRRTAAEKQKELSGMK